MSQDEGFTLIEIALVIAIAAAIILVVLLAVGGAQRSRRDTARQNIVGQISAAEEQFAANNSGSYGDVTTGSYLQNVTAATTATVTAPINIAAGTGFKCGAGGTMTAAAGRFYAITYWSEVAGASQCKDNQ